MGMYEEYKKLLKECITDARELLPKEYGFSTVNEVAIITLAIKLADVKVVADELEE